MRCLLADLFVSLSGQRRAVNQRLDSWIEERLTRARTLGTTISSIRRHVPFEVSDLQLKNALIRNEYFVEGQYCDASIIRGFEKAKTDTGIGVLQVTQNV